MKEILTNVKMCQSFRRFEFEFSSTILDTWRKCEFLKYAHVWTTKNLWRIYIRGTHEQCHFFHIVVARVFLKASLTFGNGDLKCRKEKIKWQKVYYIFNQSEQSSLKSCCTLIKINSYGYSFSLIYLIS